jgi:hypothetical protein
MNISAPFARILLMALGLQLPAIASAEISWEQAIVSVEEKSSKYYSYAMDQGSGHPGTALNGYEHDRHICAITGRMLGFREEILEAETLDETPLSPDVDPMEIMLHAVSLDAWVAAARRAIELTENQKKSLWNLECLGKHGIPRTASIDDPELKGDFSINGDTLVVYGDIDRGFSDRFRVALDAHPDVLHVALGSAGGSVYDALLAGVAIRERGLTTTLHGPCFSACPLVFMGGVKRTIWMGPGPHLGFHQVYNASGEVPLSDDVYMHISEYLLRMGINPAAVVGWMIKAGQHEMFEPDLEDLCPPKVATWVQRICY